MDNYTSDFSLNVINKIKTDSELATNGQIGFGIANIDEENMTGQIEVRYDITVLENKIEAAKIKITMNALFQGPKNMDNNTFENMLKINGATTLSHLCRAYINSVTAQSGMPPILIPLINFIEFFKNAEKE